MEKPGRGSNPTGYRFGFNGVEADNALMPGRTGYNFGARMYDGRTGRCMSKDPLEVKYPFYSPYHSMANNPMLYVDPDGRKNVIYIHIDKNFAQGKIDIEKLKDNIRKAMFECSPLGMFYGIVFVNEVMEKKYLDPSDVSVSISDLYYLHENFPGVYSQDGAGSTPIRSGFESPAGVSINNIYKYGGSEPYVAWVALHEAIHRITQMAGNEDFIHEEMAIDGKWSPNNMLDGLDYKQEISGKTIDQLIGNGFFDLSTNRLKMITSVIEVGDPVDNASQGKAIETGANRADIGTPMETRFSKTTVTTEGSKTETK
jgi:RHS repeat-associated protein